MQSGTIKSLWNEDLQLEANFSRFLDACLYEPITQLIRYPKDVLPMFKRVRDRDLQYRGVDLILDEGNHITRIDEKSQLHYLNRNVQTFAMELSYLKNGIVEAGWFLDSRKLTDAYMFCWPYGEKLDQGDLYYGVKALLVFKHHLIAELSSRGFSREQLAIRDACIREGQKDGRYLTRDNDIWFYFSRDKYAEQMINLIIRTSLLEKIAVANLSSVYHPENGTVTLCGQWVKQSVCQICPVSYYAA